MTDRSTHQNPVVVRRPPHDPTGETMGPGDITVGAGGEPSLGDLIGELTSEFGTLVTAHIDLAKSELGQTMDQERSPMNDRDMLDRDMGDRDTDTERLRADIEEQRAAISNTVGQIEDRVSPGRIMARRRDRMRGRLIDAKDSIFGNDEADSWYPAGGDHSPNVSETPAHAAEAVQDLPRNMRRQTRGNPMAAGMVALGAGWLVGSLLPQTRKETQLAHRIEPEITEAASAVRTEGMDLADDLREPAEHAAEDVKRTGRQAATAVKVEARR